MVPVVIVRGPKLLVVPPTNPPEGLDGWLAPGAPWPVHDRSEAQKAMIEAKRAGFRLRPLDHAFGKLRCDGHPDGEVHQLTVYKTPRGDAHGTATAHKIRSKVTQCLRKTQGPVGDLRGDAETLLEWAEGLTVAATAYSRHEQLGERVQTELEVANEQDTDAALERALDLDARRIREAELSRRGLERFGLGDRYPPKEGAAELIALAEAALDRVVALPLDAEQGRRADALRAALSDPWSQLLA
jgi:hypothetical protein